MIEISNLSKSFDGRKLFSIDRLVLPKKGLILIKGENGCGKTTFLNIVYLLDMDYSGNILFNGKEIKRFSEKERAEIRRNEISYVFQKNNLVFSAMSV